MAETHLPRTAAHTGRDANPEVRHETSDINIRGVLGFGAALILGALFMYFVVWVLFVYFDTHESARPAPFYPLAVGQEQRLPPEPRLQTNPRADLHLLRTGEDAVLNSYGWVDKNNGVVQIPIGEAMRLTVEHGLPARKDAGTGK